MSVTETKLITADELLALGDIGRCELLYGELVMMSWGEWDHGLIAARFGRYLGGYIEEHDLGISLAAGTGYLVEESPDLVRAPDASFVKKSRSQRTRKFFRGVPDLAVEVISPDETRREVCEKVNMWLAHGTISVWVADCMKMTVSVHRAGAKTILFSGNQELRDEAVLPGFVLALSKIFMQP